MTAQNTTERWMTIQNTDWQRRKTKGEVDDNSKHRLTKEKANIAKGTISQGIECSKFLFYRFENFVNSFESFYQLSKTLTAFTSWPQFDNFALLVSTKEATDRARQWWDLMKIPQNIWERMEGNIAKPPKLESESDYFLREREEVTKSLMSHIPFLYTKVQIIGHF